MSIHQKLGVLAEGVWLLIIFLLPVYFNPWCYYPFYFVKASALVFLVSLLLGVILAQWFLAPSTFKIGDLPATIRRSPLQFAALALGVMWVVATIFSVMPGRSLWGHLAGSTGLIPNLAWIIFFLVISQKLKERAQLYRALYALLISSGIVALLGVLQVISPDVLPKYKINGRIASTDGNPLSLSGFLAMTMPITLALMILNWYGWGSQLRSRYKFAILLVLFALQLACLIFAQYSITLLLFIIGIFVFFTLTGVFLRRKATVILSILSILFAVVIAGIVFGQVLFIEKAVPVTDPSSIDAPAAGQVSLPTLGIRVQNWKCAVDVWMNSPEIPFTNDELRGLRRIIGYGPETFMALSQLSFPGDLKSYYTYGSVGISQPENHYLYLAVTLGILGLLSFLTLLAVFFTLGFRLLIRGNKEVIILAAALVAAVAQYCAHIVFNPSIIDPELVFWLVLGLTVVLARVEDAGCDTGSSMAYCSTMPPRVANRARKLISIVIIIIFTAVGCGLTLPLVMANMKVRDGFMLWAKDPNLALVSLTEATLLGPDQAEYHDILGHFAFNLAGQDKTAPAVKSTLRDLGTLAGNAAIRIEPQMAIWRYRLADREMYWTVSGNKEKDSEILYLYQEADQLYPGNAVILNKWSVALMLMGDYEGAGRKLAESRKADPLWSQTSFYSGLLSSMEGDREKAGEMFVLTGKGHARLVRSVSNGPNDIDYFINFCSQVTKYAVIDRVAGDLKFYADGKDDWIAWTFLGIAEIFAGRPGDAITAFNKSAELIPDGDIAELKGVIMGSAWDTPALQAAARDMVGSLSARQAK